MGQAKKSSLEYCQRNQLIVEVAKAMDIKSLTVIRSLN